MKALSWLFLLMSGLVLSACNGTNVRSRYATKPVYLGDSMLFAKCNRTLKDSRKFEVEILYGSSKSYEAQTHDTSLAKKYHEGNIDIALIKSDDQDKQVTVVDDFNFGSQGWFYLIVSGHRNWGEIDVAQCSIKK